MCLSRLRPRARASSREGSTTTRCVERPLSIGCQMSWASAGSMRSSTATSIPDSARDRTRAHVAVTDACHCSACPGSPTARGSTSPCTSRFLTVSSWTWAATSGVWHQARARVDLPAPAGPASNNTIGLTTTSLRGRARLGDSGFVRAARRRSGAPLADPPKDTEDWAQMGPVVVSGRSLGRLAVSRSRGRGATACPLRSGAGPISADTPPKQRPPLTRLTQCLPRVCIMLTRASILEVCRRSLRSPSTT